MAGLLPRWAPAISIALHAGIFVLIGRYSIVPPVSATGRGLNIALRADASAESLLVDEPESSGPAGPELPATQIAPPAPAPAELSQPLIAALKPAPSSVIVAEIRFVAQLKPVPAPVKSRRTNSRANPANTSRGSMLGSSDRSDSGGGPAGGGSTGGGPGQPGYVPPQFRLRYKPIYPPAARAKHLEGTVLLLADVSIDGRVTHIQIQRSCGHIILDRAALEAVRSWRFEPARQNGVAIAAKVEVPVRFRFEDQ